MPLLHHSELVSYSSQAILSITFDSRFDIRDPDNFEISRAVVRDFGAI